MIWFMAAVGVQGLKISTAQLAAWLPAVIGIADAAGREIMRIYQTGFNVTFKDDRSPLTEADLAAQRVIGAGLAALTPDIAMLGEESPPQTIAQRRAWRRLWLVDPLDGTREFVKRNGEFTVNIALIEDHEPVLGIVAAPARAVLYAAARGCGAIRRDADGTRHPIQACRHAATPLRVLGSRSHGDALTEGLLARFGAQARTSVGSALKFGLLAEGLADLYLRCGPTSEWDTAAGQALLTEAGGCVLDLAGAPLRYNARDGLINPSFLAFADRSRDWVALLE
jgi:3'(2'), 5'-bisphosphate nucleotidase